ncbi:MAG TPA: Nramp family divalent metal transporter [Chloroflexia bacterium]|nr:Nramp family divalent metal transporter [Chloroflexia bacterium]
MPVKPRTSVLPWRGEAGPSLPGFQGSIAIPMGGPRWRRALAFVGPGFLVAVGYMDPGNWATDLAGGAQFGYLLLSVILIANLVAILLQALSVRLGIATGRDLAQACRDSYPVAVTRTLWVLCEVAIIACDLAEVIGSAIALKLLFGLPLVTGICITGADVLLILLLQNRGFRYIEALVITLIATIGACFVGELLLVHPSLAGIAAGFLPQPRVLIDPHALYIAIGILGATVMPHNLYLHSALVQTRNYDRTSLPAKREAIQHATLESSGALTIALFINAAILIMAAATFFGTAHALVAGIEEAYQTLTPLLGTSLASVLFAVALLASGQNSTLTGTLAGQIVMEGFLNLQLKPWIQRLITRSLAIVPAVIVAVLAGEHGVNDLLILSQVVLSMQLSFAVFPLLQFTGDRRKMGEFVNPRWLKVVGWSVGGLIALANLYLLWQQVFSPA